jgi:hypothetical protein
MAESKKLEQLMAKSHKGTVGTGELIDLDSLSTDEGVSIDRGEVEEPFWDLELVRPDDDPMGFGGYPVDIEGSATYGDNAWDRVQLGEHLLPGLWTATGTPAIKLDIQKPKGFDGAAIITRGYLPTSITLKGLLWTPVQWYLLRNIIPAIWRPPFKVSAQDVVLGKKGKITAEQHDEGEIVGQQRSMSVINPALNSIGIFYLVLQRITPMEPYTIPGVRQMIIECVEYIPEPDHKPSAIKKVKGQKSSSRGKTAFDKEIDKDARKPKAPSTSKAAIEPEKL